MRSHGRIKLGVKSDPEGFAYSLRNVVLAELGMRIDAPPRASSYFLDQKWLAGGGSILLLLFFVCVCLYMYVCYTSVGWQIWMLELDAIPLPSYQVTPSTTGRARLRSFVQNVIIRPASGALRGFFLPLLLVVCVANPIK